MADELVSRRGRPKGTRTAVVELETVSFKAPKEFVERVRTYAKEHKQSVSEMVRDGLTWRLEDDPLSYRYGTVTSDETAYKGNTGTLLLDSRVLRDEELNERRQQCFASLADVMHKLEETEVQREFFL
jgi:hypothetical protein